MSETVKTQSSTLDDAYFDRNQVVQLMATMAQDLGMNVGIRRDPDDPDWPIIMVDLGAFGGGQVSWHIPESELVVDLPDYDGEWDGHTLEDKRNRLHKWMSHEPLD